jgi:hypothetical protein
VRTVQKVGASDTTLYVNLAAMPRMNDGGLIKLGDEYLGYGSWTNDQVKGTISQVKRGWLNSTAEIHDLGGTPSICRGSRSPRSRPTLRRRTRSSACASGWRAIPTHYKKGYVLLDNEMILFEWNGQATSRTA